MIQSPERTLTFDVESVRQHFPCLAQTVREKPLVYLDNAASSQIPQPVVEAIATYHNANRSNIHPYRLLGWRGF